VLVVLQYSISLIAILAAVIISQQMKYVNNKKLGFDEKSVLYFIMRGDFQTNFDAAKQELLSYPYIKSVSLSSLPYENSRPDADVNWSGKTEDAAFLSSSVGIDHFKTFGMKMVQGRSFISNPADSSAFIINQTAANLMGEEDIIGMSFSFDGKNGKIIGIVQDYHHDSLHKPILPKVHYLGKNFWVCVRIDNRSEKTALAAIRKIWDRSAEGYPFEYSFLQDDMNHYYGSEIKLERAVTTISILTILISSLGLFGLVAHTINRKRKEIGIRKVLGASVGSILFHLLSDFTRWILLANLFAWPIAWYFISKWLQGFAYHINLSIWLFVLSGAVALFIAVATVSFRTIKAAIRNPVESLKYE
jgi:hypothetical protein